MAQAASWDDHGAHTQPYYLVTKKLDSGVLTINLRKRGETIPGSACV